MEPSLLDFAEKLRRTLLPQFKRLSNPVRIGNCVEIAGELDEKTIIFLYLFKGDNSFIIKILAEPKGCEDSLITPWGLFVIEKDLNEASKRIAEKAHMLKKLLKLKKLNASM